MIYVVPTVLEPSEAAVRKRIQAVSPHFSRAQLDVLNNTLVPHSSFADPAVIETMRAGLVFEVDLMVDLRSYDLAQWNRPWVDTILFHVEATDDVAGVIAEIRSWGKKAFISLNPDTEVKSIEPYVGKADGVLFMTVQPGKSGNPFQPQVVETIRDFRARHPKIEIEADGGVDNETLPVLLEAGVNGVAVGSYLANDKIEERSLELLAIAG